MNLHRASGVMLLLVAHEVLAEPASVQLYGRLNAGLESTHYSGPASAAADHHGPAERLSNYRSVLGIHGDESIGEVKVIFQVEGTIAPDTGNGAIAARDTRIGLSGPFGTVFGGNWPTPYNASTSGLDPFYPTTAGYMSIMANGSAPTVNNVSDTSSFDRRQQNSVHYWTPDWHGLSVHLAHGLNEESPPSGAKPSLTSAAIIYEHGPLYLAVAHEVHHEYQGPGLNDHGSKIALARTFGHTRVAAIGERLRYATTTGHLQRTSWYLSVSHQAGPHGLRFGIAKALDATGGATERIGFVKAGPDTGALHYTLGYDYMLSRRTSLFAFYSRLRNKAQASYDFAINGLDADPGSTLSDFAVGIRHAF